jgi:hypothetical protein
MKAAPMKSAAAHVAASHMAAAHVASTAPSVTVRQRYNRTDRQGSRSNHRHGGFHEPARRGPRPQIKNIHGIALRVEDNERAGSPIQKIARARAS